MLGNSWKKEISRDLLSLGSIVFYTLVMIRALVGPYWIFFLQLLIGAITLLIFYLLIKDLDTYISRGIILAFFTSLFYENILFAIFAGLILILMILSSYRLGNAVPKILKGIVCGIISSIVSCAASPSLSSLLFNG